MNRAGYFSRFHRGIGRDRARRGVTAVEMALIAPAFFLLMMGITEMCLIEGAQQILENAAFNTSRLAKTGYVATGETQTQTVQQVLFNELQSYGTLINTAKVTVTTDAYNSFSSIGEAGQGTTGLGTASQIVVYVVSYPWPLFTPIMSNLIGTSGHLTLTTRIVVRNEPYG